MVANTLFIARTINVTACWLILCISQLILISHFPIDDIFPIKKAAFVTLTAFKIFCKWSIIVVSFQLYYVSRNISPALSKYMAVKIAADANISQSA
jgi:hypothetical protein